MRKQHDFPHVNCTDKERQPQKNHKWRMVLEHLSDMRLKVLKLKTRSSKAGKAERERERERERLEPTSP